MRARTTMQTNTTTPQAKRPRRQSLQSLDRSRALGGCCEPGADQLRRSLQAGVPNGWIERFGEWLGSEGPAHLFLGRLAVGCRALPGGAAGRADDGFHLLGGKLLSPFGACGA